MKKLFLLVTFVMVATCLLSSCDNHTHNFGEWKIEKEATCTENGERARYCSCGEKQTKEIYATDHTEVIDNAVAATCTKTGLTEGKHCSVCDEVLLSQSETPLIPHKYDDNYDESCNECGFVRDADCAHIILNTLPAKEATCTETGLTEGKVCAKCEEIIVQQNIIGALGHTEVIDEAVAPTCTATGLTEGKHCSVCNTTLVEQTTVSAKGHTEEITVSATEPTCTEKGRTEGTKCSVCDVVLVSSEEIPANGHTEVIDEAVAPTCTATGLTEGKHCSVCNTTLVEQTILSANGHNYDAVKCTVCGEYNPTYGSQGLEYYRSDDEKSYRVVVGTCTDTDIIIPSIFNGLPVTSISDDAFYRCTRLTSIVIPDSVTSIGDSAFYYCTSLTSVVIPENVTSIGNDAFCWCKSLTSIDIPDSVTSIGDGAFSVCKSLTSVVIPDSVTSIGNGAFLNCDSLTSIVIPDSVTSISNEAFSDCDSLTSIIIPDSVTIIGDYAFYWCNSLTYIVIPSGVTRIGNDAFYNCELLTDVYYVGSEAEWNQITIGSDNDKLTGANIHYNYAP
jgi:hypothetical protein